MPSTDEVPVSCGEPLTQRPVTSARSARRFSSSASKRSGTSASTAARTSIVPTPGIGLRPGQPAGVGPLERDRQAGDPQLAEAAGGGRGLRGRASRSAAARSVVADSRLPVTGSGDAGRLPPAAAALQVGSPLFAVTGSVARRRAERGGERARLAGAALRGGGRGDGGEQGEAEQAEGDGGAAARRGPGYGIPGLYHAPGGAALRAGASRAARARLSRSNANQWPWPGWSSARWIAAPLSWQSSSVPTPPWETIATSPSAGERASTVSSASAIRSWAAAAVSQPRWLSSGSPKKACTAGSNSSGGR